MRILIVRLGALGDIVHTVPAAAALRRAFPGATIDWIVDETHAAFAGLVTAVDTVLQLGRGSLASRMGAIRALRARRYDVALDFQGLLKSALLARASGARRVIGFPMEHLRERTARPFYSEVRAPGDARHVIEKNLRLLESLGVRSRTVEFPLRRGPSAARDAVLQEAGSVPVALVNPGAAWPNKRWPAARYGEVARFVREARGMHPYVLWGPDERALAEDVVDASGGAARLAPQTTTVDLLELSRIAALMISGDTGPLHIAAAAGTPVVAVFGPTDPARNGPWSPADVAVSRYAACGCSYRRRCQRASWCLDDVGVPEVTAAIEGRLDEGILVNSQLPTSNSQATPNGEASTPNADGENGGALGSRS